MTAPIIDPSIADLVAEAEATGERPSLEALLDRAEQLSPYEENHLFESWCANLISAAGDGDG